MKTLYLDCAMGAAGDMLTGALLELHPDPAGFLARMNRLGLPGVRVETGRETRGGVPGTRVHVTVHGQEEGCGEHSHHHHSGLSDITALVTALPLPEQVKAQVLAVYGRIAQAEAAAHGCPVELVHFHEVGALDAVADVTAVCWLLRELAPEEVLASPVHVGSGTVRCAHGELPVPAPATAILLSGVPTCAGEIRGELCTPTGAALLTHFVRRFVPAPAMEQVRIGRGLGAKEFPRPNVLTAYWGITP